MAKKLTAKGMKDPVLQGLLMNRLMWDDPIQQHMMQKMVENSTLLSRRVLDRSGGMDPRRNIDDECGYPAEINPDDYRRMFDRDPIASRVVMCEPLECWQESPEVYEDEDVNTITAFEQGWKDLPKGLRGESYFIGNEGNPIWEACCRADIVSRIGTFGVLLLGFNDGRRLDEPVEGFEDSKDARSGMTSVYGTESQYGSISLMPTEEPQQEPPYTQGWEKHSTMDQGGSLSPNPEMSKSQPAYQTESYGDTRDVNDKLTTPQIQQNGKPRPGKPPVKNAVENTPPFPMQKPRDSEEPSTSQLTEASYPPPVQQDSNDMSSQSEGSEGPDLDSTDMLKSAQDKDVPEFDVRGQLMTPGGTASEGDEPGVVSAQPVEMPIKLIFIRPYDETLVYVTQYESDPTNPRFGHPVMYNVTLNDPRTLHGGTGLSFTVAKVHWSRIIHIADNKLNSGIFGEPAMKPVFNRLLDLQKLYGGSAEMYWRGAFPGYSLETHPQLGGEVQFDTADIKDQMEQYMNGLQRYVAIAGMTMKGQAPQVVDPTPQISVHIQAICIRIGVPQRVFMGSEQGELASSQDSDNWLERKKHRKNNYCTPGIVVPLVDRLIKCRVLPPPQEGYHVTWPDKNTESKLEQAQYATAMSTALSAFQSGGIATLMSEEFFLVHICGFDEETVMKMQESAAEQQQLMQQQQQEMHEATVDQMTNPDLVPDNIHTGPSSQQHVYGDINQPGAAPGEGGEEDGPPDDMASGGPQGGPPAPPAPTPAGPAKKMF